MNHRALLIPLLIVVLFSGSVHAQFPNFPDSNALWLIGYYEQGVFQYDYAYHFRSADHDTLLNGVWYNSLWLGVEGQGGAFAGGIRSDTDNRVYYFHPNTSAEYLLYDFDPMIGDSMEVWVGEYGSPGPSLMQMHVASIEILQNGSGTQYKQVGILSDFAFHSGESVSQYWLEGVGGDGGLLSTNGTAYTPFAATVLECMQYNDTLWPTGTPGECSLTGILERDGTGAWKAIPNPSSGYFWFNTRPSALIEVFDQLGRPVLRTTGATVDLSHEPAGTYIARVREESAWSYVRLVVQR